MPIACENENPTAIDPMHLPICTRPLQPGEAPGSLEPVPDLATAALVLSSGNTGRQQQEADRNDVLQFASGPFQSKSSGKTLSRAYLILPIVCLILSGIQELCMQSVPGSTLKRDVTEMAKATEAPGNVDVAEMRAALASRISDF